MKTTSNTLDRKKRFFLNAIAVISTSICSIALAYYAGINHNSFILIAALIINIGMYLVMHYDDGEYNPHDFNDVIDQIYNGPNSERNKQQLNELRENKYNNDATK